MRSSMKGWLLGLGVAGIVQACGAGTDFATVVVTAIGSSPNRPAVADFNGDGFADVVVGRASGVFGIDVMLGKGDGSFNAAPGSPLTQPAATTAAAAGDFNNDGRQDFVVGVSAGKVSVYIGDGAGGFVTTGASPISFASASAAVGRLVVADLNNDSHADIVGVVPGTSQISVLLGDGTGNFGASASYPVGFAGDDLVVIKANADAFYDVAVSSTAANNVQLLTNKGDGTFNAAVVQTIAQKLNGIGAGDINKDGNVDLVVTDQAKKFYLMTGSGTGTFSAGAAVTDSNGSTASLTSVTTADFDNDGKTDVYMLDKQASGGLHISSGAGTTTLPIPATYALGDSPISADIADFNGDGAPDFASVLSPAAGTGSIAVLLNLHGTKTALTTSGSPVVAGSSVSFTATVTQLKGSVPTGTVTFKDGAATLATVALNGAAAATYATSALGLGSHAITATYSGDTTCHPSVSSVVTQVVQGTTSTSVTSSGTPTVYGQAPTFTASVAVTAGVGTPTGTVTFTADGNVVGTGTLNGVGVATFTPSAASPLSVGSHTIIAEYGADALFKGSTSASITHVVNKADTAIILASSGNPALVGASVTFTATTSVTAPGLDTLSGDVTFNDGAAAIGTGTINPATGVATLSVSNLSLGAHTITAVFPGTANLNTSTSAPLAQSIALAVSTVTVKSSKSPALAGSAVTFTATVASTGATPTGMVEFYDDTTLLATSAIAGGVAVHATTSLPVGTHSIVAKYLGDGSNAAATGSVSQIISKNPTTLTLKASKVAVLVGDTVNLTATISPSTVAGSVSFTEGATSLGVATFMAGVATFTTGPLVIGTHTFIATFGGTPDHDVSSAGVNVGAFAPVDGGLPADASVPEFDSGAPGTDGGVVGDDAGALVPVGDNEGSVGYDEGGVTAPAQDAGSGDASGGDSDSGCSCESRSAPLSFASSFAALGLVALTLVRRRRN